MRSIYIRSRFIRQTCATGGVVLKWRRALGSDHQGETHKLTPSYSMSHIDPVFIGCSYNSMIVEIKGQCCYTFNSSRNSNLKMLPHKEASKTQKSWEKPAEMLSPLLSPSVSSLAPALFLTPPASGPDNVLFVCLHSWPLCFNKQWCFCGCASGDQTFPPTPCSPLISPCGANRGRSQIPAHAQRVRTCRS